MAGLLADIFSGADSIKRRVKDAVANPFDYGQQVLGQTKQNLLNIQDLQDRAFDPKRPTKVADQQAFNQLTDAYMNGVLGFAPAGVTVWHGSPYLFNKLDPSKRGTGEGAQAYGVGAGYTAEARPVAERYRRATMGGQDMAGQIAATHLELYKTPDRAISALESGLTPNITKEARDVTGKAIDLIKQGQANTGFLYKGDIPDENIHKFLDWDRPISQQSQEIQNIAKQFGVLTTPSGLKEARGSDLYKAIAGAKAKPPYDTSKEWSNYKDATDYLQEAGVSGIRYLDQGSRAEGKGTSNFVPFRPEDFKILEINDKPIEDWISKGLLAP